MKYPYCKVELPGDWRDKEHIKICKNVSPEVRYIHSGIPQKGYPDANRKPCELFIVDTKAGKNEQRRV